MRTSWRLSALAAVLSVCAFAINHTIIAAEDSDSQPSGIEDLIREVEEQERLLDDVSFRYLRQYEHVQTKPASPRIRQVTSVHSISD